MRSRWAHAGDRSGTPRAQKAGVRSPPFHSNPDMLLRKQHGTMMPNGPAGVLVSHTERAVIAQGSLNLGSGVKGPHSPIRWHYCSSL